MTRRQIFLVLAALLGALALWTGAWFLAAGQARQAALRWIEAKRAQGYYVQYTALAVAGFPFHLRLELADPEFGAGEGGEDWLWRGGAVSVRIAPWSPHRLGVMAPGAHSLALARRGTRSTYLLDAGWIDGTILLSADWDFESVTASLREAEIGIAGRPERAQITGLDFEFRVPPQGGGGAPTAELSFSLDQLGLPDGLEAPFGGNIGKLQADLALMGRIPPGPLKDALQDWRAQGGTVEVRSAALVWSELSLEGDGSAALDRALQPMGAFAVRVSGYAQAFDALVAAELVRPTAAATIKVLLNLISQPGPDGASRATMPLTVQDGEVSIGPAILMALPRVRWE